MSTYFYGLQLVLVVCNDITNCAIEISYHVKCATKSASQKIKRSIAFDKNINDSYAMILATKNYIAHMNFRRIEACYFAIDCGFAYMYSNIISIIWQSERVAGEKRKVMVSYRFGRFVMARIYCNS